MPKQYKAFLKGISLIPKASTGEGPYSDTKGDVELLTSTNKLYFHNGTINDPIVQETVSATLTNKSISFTTNTITGTALELKTAITGTTGSGDLVFATSPSLITPSLGDATANTINKLTITTPATGSTLTIADGKTLTANSSLTLSGTDGKTLSVNNSLSFSGTDSSSVAFGNGGTVAYIADKLSVFASTTSSELAGVISDETGTGVLVFNNQPTLVSPLANEIKLVNTGTVTLSASAATATYPIAFPAAAPGTSTALVWNGSVFEWGQAGGWKVLSQLTLTAGGQITNNSSYGQQTILIQASAVGNVTLSTTPFLNTPTTDGSSIRLIGNSDTNTVTILHNNASKGCLLNGNCTLFSGYVIELQYIQTLDRFVEVSRNF